MKIYTAVLTSESFTHIFSVSIENGSKRKALNIVVFDLAIGFVFEYWQTVNRHDLVDSFVLC